MDKPVHAHIAHINSMIQQLIVEKESASRDALAAHNVETSIKKLRLALSHFELGIQLEKEVEQESITRRKTA